MSVQDLPLGMRQNNPGNLRKPYGLATAPAIVNGYAKFTTLADGCESLAKLVFDYYSVHRLLYLPQFVQRYAPASENDVQAYINGMAQFLHLDLRTVAVTDLRLDRAWFALDFIRALIRMECGAPKADWVAFPEWVSINTVSTAMIRANKWRLV